MASYELQIFANQHWQIASVADDRALAIADAKRMCSSKRHLAVRVVEETFDLAAEMFITKTVYSGSRTQEAPSNFLEDATRRNDRRLNAHISSQGAASLDCTAPGQDNWILRGVALAGVLVVGAVALGALKWLEAVI